MIFSPEFCWISNRTAEKNRLQLALFRQLVYLLSSHIRKELSRDVVGPLNDNEFGIQQKVEGWTFVAFLIRCSYWWIFREVSKIKRR